MIRVFRSTDDIPEYHENDHLWDAITSQGLLEACVLSMFSELADEVGSLTDEQCRSKLARMQGYYNLAFMRERVDEAKRPQEEINAPLPDPEFY
jgi:hypothetical protein